VGADVACGPYITIPSQEQIVISNWTSNPFEVSTDLKDRGTWQQVDRANSSPPILACSHRIESTNQLWNTAPPFLSVAYRDSLDLSSAPSTAAAWLCEGVSAIQACEKCLYSDCALNACCLGSYISFCAWFSVVVMNSLLNRSSTSIDYNADCEHRGS